MWWANQGEHIWINIFKQIANKHRRKNFNTHCGRRKSKPPWPRQTQRKLSVLNLRDKCLFGVFPVVQASTKSEGRRPRRERAGAGAPLAWVPSSRSSVEPPVSHEVRPGPGRAQLPPAPNPGVAGPVRGAQQARRPCFPFCDPGSAHVREPG